MLRTEHDLGLKHQYIARLLHGIAELRRKKGDVEAALVDEHSELAESESFMNGIRAARHASRIGSQQETAE